MPVDSPFNHSYGTYTRNNGSAVGIDGGLAGRPARPMGRSANNPRRIIEQARRQGNVEPALQWGMMDEQHKFQDEQGGKSYDRAKELRASDYAFQDAQGTKQRDFSEDQSSKQFGRQLVMQANDVTNQTARDEKQRGWQLQDQQNQGIDSAFMLPLPDGSGAVPMVKDKMGRANMAGGFMPTREKAQVQTPEEIAKHISDNLSKGIIASHDGKSWNYTPIKPGKPQDDGSVTTTYDDKGHVLQKQTRQKMSGGGAPNSSAGGAANKKQPSAFLGSLGSL